MKVRSSLFSLIFTSGVLIYKAIQSFIKEFQMENILILLIAILPAVLLMIYIYFQDNHEKEPIGLLLGIFGLGILSAVPALVLELIADKIILLIFGGTNLLYLAVSAFFGVAIIEEGVKFFAAYILTWRNRHFNFKFDGIVYCLFGSMGFAAIENVFYLISEETESAISLGISRGFLAIPAHAMCAIFMGYYYGNAKYSKSYGDRVKCRGLLVRGFIIASSLHAFYDFCLMTQQKLFILIFAVFVVAADTLTIIRISRAKKENQRMYEAPQYRQYWAANPDAAYQPYGGYAAPTYGGYSYNTQSQQSIYQQPQTTQSVYQQPQTTQPVYQQPQTTQSVYQQSQTIHPIYQQTQVTQPQAVQMSHTTQSIRNRLIYCPVCGKVNNFNAFFCNSCGASLHQL